MSKRYEVVGADRAGNAWTIFESDDLTEAVSVKKGSIAGQGVWDHSRDEWASEEDED